MSAKRLKAAAGNFQGKRRIRMTAAAAVAVLALVALKALPYSSALFRQVSPEEVESQKPDPDFKLGGVRWAVRAYAADPKLAFLRHCFQTYAAGKTGLEAARLVTEGIASRSPIGNPSEEFVTPAFNPARSLVHQLGGEPGHCTSRSGSVAAVLLAAGIPARLVQIIPVDRDGRLLSQNGHNIVEVWDESCGWALIDPAIGSQVIDHQGRICSAVRLNRDRFCDPLSFPSSRGMYTPYNGFYGADYTTYALIYPEPWLYMRSGTRVAPPPFRGCYVSVRPGHWQLGQAQYSLYGLLVVIQVYLVCEAAVACLGALSWCRARAVRGTRRDPGNVTIPVDLAGGCGSYRHR